MAKLTHGDIEELTAFFHSPLSAAESHGVAAQSYEPKGAGYQPATDMKLATLVFRGVRHGKSQWARMKRVVDQLSFVHVEVLRVLCRGDAETLARQNPRALAAGLRFAADRHRVDHLNGVLSQAHRDEASPGTCAMRVLEANRTFAFDARSLTQLELLDYADRAIRAGLVDVEAETDALIDVVTTAYHAAKALAADWRQSVARREETRRESFRASLRATREAKDSARFRRRLAS